MHDSFSWESKTDPSDLDPVVCVCVCVCGFTVSVFQLLLTSSSAHRRGFLNTLEVPDSPSVNLKGRKCYSTSV